MFAKTVYGDDVVFTYFVQFSVVYSNAAQNTRKVKFQRALRVDCVCICMRTEVSYTTRNSCLFDLTEMCLDIASPTTFIIISASCNRELKYKNLSPA